MPSKKKKYNARFPAGRIKKIMQTDEEVGKVAQAVPVIISRTLELFVESLLTKSAQITQSRNAKTLTPSHMKQCILSESRFDFLKDLVKNIPDATTQEDLESAGEMSAFTPPSLPTDTPLDVQNLAPSLPTPPANQKLSFAPNFYTEQGTSKTSTVIQYGSPVGKIETPKVDILQYGSSSVGKTGDAPKIDFSIKSLVPDPEPKIHIDLTNIIRQPISDVPLPLPPLIPIVRNNLYTHQSNNDNLCIDEDYDN